MASQKNGVSPAQNRVSPAVETGEGKRHCLAPGAACTICEGVGWLRANVPFGHPDFGRSVLCACCEVRQTLQCLQQRRHAANLDTLRDNTFKSFNSRITGVQEAFRASSRFAANPQGWLMLVGSCGCGKTHLAAAIANQRLESGAAVFFTTTPDLLDSLRAAFTSPENYRLLFARVREVELLVLDDLGAQRSSQWSSEKLLQILTHRANAALPTVITAMPKDLPGLEERLRSRLTDTQLVTTVLLKHAKDFRPQKVITDTMRRK
jgi:DNA replication protein DnaC